MSCTHDDDLQIGKTKRTALQLFVTDRDAQVNWNFRPLGSEESPFKIEFIRINIEKRECKVNLRNRELNMETSGCCTLRSSHWPVEHISHKPMISHMSFHTPCEKN